ncbi:hypothetical protein [Parafilimonas sp.]|uniref:hypothetical protein n=1 Tax=Parafilimonas sp. TaxID=1969739 RepID=UPI0039E663CE
MHSNYPVSRNIAIAKQIILFVATGLCLSLFTACSKNDVTATGSSTVVNSTGGGSEIVHIESADGTEALTFLAPVSYSTLLFSSSKLKSSTTYNVYIGGSVSSGTDFYGLYTSGTYTKGAAGTTFTTTELLTQTGGTISNG